MAIFWFAAAIPSARGLFPQADDECHFDDAAAQQCAISALQARARREVVEVSMGGPGPLNSSVGRSQHAVRILHLSDTHTLHRTIERSLGTLPPADILLHTGDVSNLGTDAELGDFNDWLGELKDRFSHILLVTGNHDWIDTIAQVQAGKLPPAAALNFSRMRERLPNAQVLDSEGVEVMGLRIFGSGWQPWYGLTQPGDAVRMQWTAARKKIFEAWSSARATPAGAAPSTNRYSEIPGGVDVLMTHEPAWSIFDASWNEHWGSSRELRTAIERAGPRAHLFGHVHEQRGLWLRTPDTNGSFAAGVEYSPAPGRPFKPRPPPPADYPVQLVANTALENNPGIDRMITGQRGSYHLVAPARLITATWTNGKVSFTALIVSSIHDATMKAVGHLELSSAEEALRHVLVIVVPQPSLHAAQFLDGCSGSTQLAERSAAILKNLAGSSSKCTVALPWGFDADKPSNGMFAQGSARASVVHPVRPWVFAGHAQPPCGPVRDPLPRMRQLAPLRFETAAAPTLGAAVGDSRPRLDGKRHSVRNYWPRGALQPGAVQE
eukprot:CAMPEP_0179044394 /NCGR_PEP_ID=MMETSP0796-20121207/17652_1 /TAXON_ID=73915 /ORGANISM="Pyrodinium bahamense, Strain pbaha01" /LENGTH=550 /DNA_ID=CAMNT_0020740793 /DNA_START=71 /DNA_END=1721 /DNA_ORIENTATION=+